MRRFLFIIPLLLAVSTVQAGYLNLAWDPNQEAYLAGYKVYLGTSSGSYSHFADVGNVTSCHLENLADGVTYYFVATAYDTTGNESPYSLEVFGAPISAGGNTPPVANAGPGQVVKPGVIVAIDGSNSTDTDSGIASYQWTQTSGTPITLSDPAAAKPTFVSPKLVKMAHP